MELNLTTAAEAARGVRRVGHPLCAYIYDLHSLRQHASALVGSLPEGCELFYAIKANSELPILEALAPIVHGFEVSSGGELDLVRSRFPTKPVVFGGPGKTDEELRAALSLGVELLHAESLGELRRLAWLARAEGRKASVLLRCNLPLEEFTTTSLTMGGRASQFGIDAGEVPSVLAWLKQHPEITVRGLHFHLLSHQLDAQAHLRLLEVYLRTFREWKEQYGLAIDHLNVGGGLGINYRDPASQFDWPAFTRGLSSLLARCAMNPPRIRFELGRYITASCGYYVTEVLDIKQCFGRTFAVSSGGTHHFRTPQAQQHSHPVSVVPIEQWSYPFERAGITRSKVTLVGSLCTPKDVLASDVFVERLRVGDLLVYPYAGAYAWNISHQNFLRHPPPAVIYLGQARGQRKTSEHSRKDGLQYGG
jgi:diaminopimelate decarboxylase